MVVVVTQYTSTAAGPRKVHHSSLHNKRNHGGHSKNGAALYIWWASSAQKTMRGKIVLVGFLCLPTCLRLSRIRGSDITSTVANTTNNDKSHLRLPCCCMGQRIIMDHLPSLAVQLFAECCSVKRLFRRGDVATTPRLPPVSEEASRKQMTIVRMRKR